MHRLDPNNAENAERIRAVILSGNVNDDGSIGNETKSHEDYVEPTETYWETVENAKSGDDCCNEVDTTDNCFIGKDKTKCGKVKCTTHFRCRWQNILKYYLSLLAMHGTPLCLSKRGTASLQTKFQITLFSRQIRAVLLLSRERDARLTDKTEIEIFVVLLCT
jgi:hypothetical protein